MTLADVCMGVISDEIADVVFGPAWLDLDAPATRQYDSHVWAWRLTWPEEHVEAFERHFEHEPGGHEVVTLRAEVEALRAEVARLRGER